MKFPMWQITVRSLHESVLLGSFLISCEKHFLDHLTQNFELAMKVLHIMFRNKICHQNNVSIS